MKSFREYAVGTSIPDPTSRRLLIELCNKAKELKPTKEIIRMMKYIYEEIAFSDDVSKISVYYLDHGKTMFIAFMMGGEAGGNVIQYISLNNRLIYPYKADDVLARRNIKEKEQIVI